MFIGKSSKVYPLEVGDLKLLPDCNDKEIAVSHFSDDEVVLLIEKNRKDRLLKGRKLIDCLNAEDTVNVRVAFVPSVPKYFILPNFIRLLRNMFRYRGSNIYHISPTKLRNLGVERTIRNRSNAYRLKRLRYNNEKRFARYDKLSESLKTNGYDDNKPMNVMICRQGGMIDSLRQGHHRISACIECGIERVSIRFSAAGYMPGPISRFFKFWKGKSIK